MAKQSTNLATPKLLPITEDNLVRADELTMEIKYYDGVETISRNVSTRYALAEWGGLFYLVE